MQFNKFLTPDAEKIFIALSDYPFLSQFTFVGGSAIAYYLNHRLSEDLDFFTWKNDLNREDLDLLIKSLSKKHTVKVTNLYLNGVDLLIDNVKVTFFASDWLELKNSTLLLKNISIATLDLLSIMKVNTFSLRAKYRDYYDIYCIVNQAIELKKILKLALEKIPGMTKKIFFMQLSYISDIEDENIELLVPKIKISLTDMNSYFEKELEKLV